MRMNPVKVTSTSLEHSLGWEAQKNFAISWLFPPSKFFAMKLISAILTSTLLLAGRQLGFSQGTFANLDFEHPELPLIPDAGFRVAITNAMPGWTGYIGGIQITKVVYNTVGIGSSEIDFQGPGSLEPILQGNYTVGMGPGGQGLTTAIGQIGTLPSNAMSMSFYIQPGSLFAVTFAGQQILLTAIGSTSNATIEGGDISAFAGQTGQLLFQGGGELDNIQFSTQPIPEPNGMSLLGAGALLLGFFRCRNSS
jgi:hypothetical protein